MNFFEDYNTFCFKKGVVIGVITGIIGTLAIISLIYLVVVAIR